MGPHYDVPLHIALSMLLAAANAGEPGPQPLSQAHPAAAPAAVPTQIRSEQDWLRAISQGAGGEALAAMRRRIFRTSSGHYYVPAADERYVILALRDDPAILRTVEGFAAAPSAPTAVVAASAATGSTASNPRRDLKGPVADRATSAATRPEDAARLASAPWRAVVRARP